jgi:hypothetical protein
MLPSDMKRLRQLEEENTKLKKPVADLSLDKIMLQAEYPVSERKSCKALRLYRSAYRYKPGKDDQAFLRKRIKEIASVRIRYGYRRVHVLLRREGWEINHKRVYRLYKLEGLDLHHPSKRRKMSQSRLPGSDTATGMNAGQWILFLINYTMVKDSAL